MDRRRPAQTGANRRKPAQTGANRRKPAIFSTPAKNYGRTRIEILTKRYFLGENFFQRNLGNGVGQF
jgi:hypothetical protein